MKCHLRSLLMIFFLNTMVTLGGVFSVEGPSSGCIYPGNSITQTEWIITSNVYPPDIYHLLAYWKFIYYYKVDDGDWIRFGRIGAYIPDVGFGHPRARFNLAAGNHNIKFKLVEEWTEYVDGLPQDRAKLIEEQTFNIMVYNYTPPTDISINGPVSINSGVTGVWNTSVGLSIPEHFYSLHYEWSYLYPCGPEDNRVTRSAPCGYWINIAGSDTPQLSTYWTKNFQLKCKVRDAYDNELTSNIISVYVIGGQNKVTDLSSTVLPTENLLNQNFPNPFNPITVINFSLAQEANIELSVYDLLGKKVFELLKGYKEAGTYNINFDGSNLSSGIYLYKITAVNRNELLFTETKRMILLK